MAMLEVQHKFLEKNWLKSSRLFFKFKRLLLKI